MRMISLQSGSNGNCIFVESCGVRLLIDAGLTGDSTVNRLSQFGIDVCSIDGVLISHDHVDHVNCAGVLYRKFQLPIWITPKTYERAASQHRLGQIDDLNFFQSGERLIFGKISVTTLRTAHDAVDGVCFVVDDGDCRLGVMTDLGRTKSIASVLRNDNSDSRVLVDEGVNKISKNVGMGQRYFSGFDEESEYSALGSDYYEGVISTLDGLFIESNFDIGMLSSGRYSRELQSRIRGRGGHLSNLEAAKLIKTAGKKLRWACLGHISKENNTHDVVLDTHREILGSKFPLSIATRYETSEILELK